MRLESTSEQVGTLVAEAMGDIKTFQRTKQRGSLRTAAEKLTRARAEDREYLPALYARALVDDLDGRAVDAIAELRDVLAEAPPFVDEVEYHLGVALYHRYNWPSLDEAIARLSSVATRTTDRLLACRSRVKLVEALGMRMVPRDPREADLVQIDAYYRRLQQEAAGVERAIEALGATRVESLSELRSALHNAKGLAAMYRSDFFGSPHKKIAALEGALVELARADELSPDHWGIHCDLGSTWMRLAHWRQNAADFAQALRSLERVVETLRPDYGFAIYEIGRTCRLAGRFDDALAHFTRALAIPYELRDVSDRRILIEQARARASSKVYP